jgi:hypothetical protein
MAFCPECGKSVADEAATCTACGKALPSSKKSAAARFNGTVMMAAPVGVKVAQPANANAEQRAASATVQAAASGGMAAEAKLAAGGGGHAGRLPAAKATMLGAGIAPARSVAEPAPHTPAVRAVVDVPVSPVPERPDAVGHAATQAALPHVPRPAPQSPSAEVMPPQGQHFLPGDPMAPPPSAAEHPGHGRSARLHIDHETAQPGLAAIPKEERVWLYWAVCGVVVLSVLVLAIGLF